MAGEQAVLYRSIETLMREGSAAGLDDEALLERLAANRDGHSLAALVDSHGPMVLGTCRRILRAPADVDDAFQSTFLVLIRKAGAIRDPSRLAGWLHGVACRVALRTRKQVRTKGVSSDVLEALSHPSSDPVLQAERNEQIDQIDEEIGRLPARYRDVIVLCDLEGRSYAEAARLLRCPLGTVQSRLARARDRLRERLIRRGVGEVTGPLFLAAGARASLPASLREATFRAAHAAWSTGAIAVTGIGLAKIAVTVAAIILGVGTCFTVLKPAIFGEGAPSCRAGLECSSAGASH